MRPLIVCRGPIRKEAMDVFTEMGIEDYGILLSEKDSIVFTHSLAPELKQIKNPRHIHRVPDYSGSGKAERQTRIEQILRIARDNNYNFIFAGYGFMAEDETFVSAIEEAGIGFIGPCAKTVRGAGFKDEAKRTATATGVSVTPGVNNLTTLTLLAKAPQRDQLWDLCKTHDLDLESAVVLDESQTVEHIADVVLEASYEKGVDVISARELGDTVKIEAAKMLRRFPSSRLRLKAIGGGGGKGQRILSAPDPDAAQSPEDAIKQAVAKAPEAVTEILNEIKANGPGDNKNMLLELNIERTRHLEIQLIGNGSWSLALGARDCSLQMHEQKLLEVSVTKEALLAAISAAEEAKRTEEVKSLRSELKTLAAMEDEAARFGHAVGLDSVSTFECIVDGEHHFFMEMNTRIQVEHRVTEMCYALKFSNPEDPEQFFVVDSLVEAMTLLAKHKSRLPQPVRVPREVCGIEARLNATNAALMPHAGGVILSWSDPLKREIRDDQGICLKNPDTNSFVKYKISGAYDSNIALLVTYGDDRQDAFANLAEILCRTKLEGRDLETNLDFHYGLVNWFLGQTTLAKPTTRFVVPYLTLLGQLKQAAGKIDPESAFSILRDNYVAGWKTKQPQAVAGKDAESTLGGLFDRKRTLLLRPLGQLLDNPHWFAGWLSLHRHHVSLEGNRIQWLENPVSLLASTYDYLNMDYREDAPAAEVIWKTDHELLATMVRFYDHLNDLTGLSQYPRLVEALKKEKPPGGISQAMWQKVKAAHQGYQAGLDLLGILPIIAQSVAFYELKVMPNLEIKIPELLLDPVLQKQMTKVLAPPPAVKADEIGAVCGGMFYAREAPGMDPFVREGDHFEMGDPLYIIEVMKMFNKVHAPFSGTIDRICIEGSDGCIVAKGQTLFKVTPDEPLVEEDPQSKAREQQNATKAMLSNHRLS